MEWKNVRGKVPEELWKKSRVAIKVFYYFTVLIWILIGFFIRAREVARVEVAILENCRTIAKAIK